MEITLRKTIEMEFGMLVSSIDFERARLFSYLRETFPERDDITYWIVTCVHNREDGSRWLSIDFQDKIYKRLTIFTPDFQEGSVEDVMVRSLMRLRGYFSDNGLNLPM